MIHSTSYTGRKQLLHSVDNIEFVSLAVQLSIMRFIIIRMKTAVLDVVCFFADSWEYTSAGFPTGKSSLSQLKLKFCKLFYHNIVYFYVTHNSQDGIEFDWIIKKSKPNLNMSFGLNKYLVIG